jgi:hypothetical protein
MSQFYDDVKEVMAFGVYAFVIGAASMLLPGVMMLIIHIFDLYDYLHMWPNF